MLVDQDRLHQLKEDAKWASSIDGQIKAVRELGTLGKVALPSLEEVLQVSVRDEIKQCCMEAIRNLGRNSMAEAGRTKKKSRRVKKTRRRSSAR